MKLEPVMVFEELIRSQRSLLEFTRWKTNVRERRIGRTVRAAQRTRG